MRALTAGQRAVLPYLRTCRAIKKRIPHADAQAAQAGVRAGARVAMGGSPREYSSDADWTARLDRQTAWVPSCQCNVGGHNVQGCMQACHPRAVGG